LNCIRLPEHIKRYVLGFPAAQFVDREIFACSLISYLATLWLQEKMSFSTRNRQDNFC